MLCVLFLKVSFFTKKINVFSGPAGIFSILAKPARRFCGYRSMGVSAVRSEQNKAPLRKERGLACLGVRD